MPHGGLGKYSKKAPGAIRIEGFFILYIRQQRYCLAGGTIETQFVCISLTAFIRALYQRNR